MNIYTLIGKDHIMSAFNKHGLLNEVWIDCITKHYAPA